MSTDEKRSKHAAYMREYRMRRKDDPEYVKRTRAYARKYAKKRASTEQGRQALRKNDATYRASKRNDPEFVARKSNHDRARYARMNDDQKAVIKARTRARRASDPDKERTRTWSRHILKKFGITADQYQAILDRQGGGCAGCGDVVDRMTGRGGLPLRLAVDHDHVSGAIRGILCKSCNQALGMMRENPDHLARLAAYALRFRTIE